MPNSDKTVRNLKNSIYRVDVTNGTCTKYPLKKKNQIMYPLMWYLS